MKEIKINKQTVISWAKNKFIVAGFAFLVWLMFFDQYHLLDRASLLNNLSEYKKEKEYYLTTKHQDSIKIQELNSDKKIEKFAREQYYMKKSNEDIIIIVEE